MIEGNTLAWERYQKGIKHLSTFGTITDTEQAYRFYDGDQWYGVQAGNERLPVFNVIKPVVQYKVSVVGQNALEIVYRPGGAVDDDFTLLSATCEALNRQASSTWERLKMNRRMWDDIRDAAIAGDKYRYFYWNEKTEKIETESIDRTNIFFGDEQNPNIQEQPYIIIAQRRPVSVVRDEAKALGAKKEDIDKIVADKDVTNQLGAQAKVEIDDDRHGKCISLVCFERTDGTMRVTRSTRDVMYDSRDIPGMELYPVASLIWSHVKGSARGVGEVKPLVANQIEINKTLYRITQAVKMYALPRLVYSDALMNPADLETVGAPLHVDGGNVQRINEIVDYLRPQPLSGDAQQLLDTYLKVTRDLAGASDMATGNINPEQASGTAILAVKRSSEMPISDSIEAYKQYVEDIALVWSDLWRTYAVNGLSVIMDDVVDEDGNPAATAIVTPHSELQMLRVEVRVEVSPSNPYDKFAQERSMENLLGAGLITFEEYVDTLPDDAVMPKAKLTEILEKRAAAQQQAMMTQQSMIPPTPMPMGDPNLNPTPMGMENIPQGNA